MPVGSSFKNLINIFLFIALPPSFPVTGFIFKTLGGCEGWTNECEHEQITNELKENDKCSLKSQLSCDQEVVTLFLVAPSGIA